MSYGDEKFVEAKKAFEKGGIAGLESSGFRVEKEELNIRPRLRNGYRAWTTWGNLIPAARIALILTFANIAICLVLVPAVPRLVSHQKTARSLTVAVVVLALVCLGTYIVLALRLLGSRPL
jgi:hypothetical protein